MTALDQIGNTPLIRFSGEVPNNNRIYLKLECDNPFGSHYDRVYLKLFKHFEEQGLLRPGATVLETTSGSAGVSFAGIGALLGYRCLVAIPEGGEKAREDAIRRAGGELLFTPAESYVSGFPRFAARFLVKNRDVVFLNHSMGPNGTENRVTVEALGAIGTEIRREIGSPDWFIPAVGNGSSVLGPARALRPRTAIMTFESFQSGVAHEMLYPGQYERKYGIAPGSLPRHQLPGTSFIGIDFPHIRLALEKERLVCRTALVSDARTDEQYTALTGRCVPCDIPRWDSIQLPPYGRSTRAGLAVALQLASTERDRNIVLIAYDKEDRYDT